MFKFNKKIKNNEDVKVSQDSINGKFSKEIFELRETIDRLDAELFAIKNPNGKLELDYPSSWSCNRYLWFTCSNGCKIHKIDVDSLDHNFSFYKVQICKDKAYVGIKFDKEDSIKDLYYLVDINKEIAIKIDNNSFEKFDLIEWSKNNNR